MPYIIDQFTQLYPPKPHFTEKDLPSLYGKVSSFKTKLTDLPTINPRSEASLTIPGLHCHRGQQRRRQGSVSTTLFERRQSLRRGPLA